MIIMEPGLHRCRCRMWKTFVTKVSFLIHVVLSLLTIQRGDYYYVAIPPVSDNWKQNTSLLTVQRGNYYYVDITLVSDEPKKFIRYAMLASLSFQRMEVRYTFNIIILTLLFLALPLSNKQSSNIWYKGLLRREGEVELGWTINNISIPSVLFQKNYFH